MRYDYFMGAEEVTAETPAKFWERPVEWISDFLGPATVRTDKATVSVGEQGIVVDTTGTRTTGGGAGGAGIQDFMQSVPMPVWIAGGGLALLMLLRR